MFCLIHNISKTFLYSFFLIFTEQQKSAQNNLSQDLVNVNLIQNFIQNNIDEILLIFSKIQIKKQKLVLCTKMSQQNKIATLNKNECFKKFNLLQNTYSSQERFSFGHHDVPAAAAGGGVRERTARSSAGAGRSAGSG